MIKAIKLAIEKGNYSSFAVVYQAKAIQLATTNDPLFWQALGKALGWGNGEWICRTDGKSLSECFSPDVHTCDKLPRWDEYAHQYFDVVLTGGDVETFWKDLLTKQQQ